MQFMRGTSACASDPVSSPEKHFLSALQPASAPMRRNGVIIRKVRFTDYAEHAETQGANALRGVKALSD